MYIGRFAPSPTGPLHFGSLLAAVASYLEARSQQGKWLLRIEDLDKPREVTGAADSIISTLKRYGFVSDAPVIYQSQRTSAYQQALEQLSTYTYSCTCSRRKIHCQANIGPLGVIYPGTCRNKQEHDQSHPADNQQYAIRVRVPDENIGFSDAVQGSHCQNLQIESGDFIIRRADGLFAYQLAVVVDDQWQGVTHIVRGHRRFLRTVPLTSLVIYAGRCAFLDTGRHQRILLPRLAISGSGPLCTGINS